MPLFRALLCQILAVFLVGLLYFRFFPEVDSGAIWVSGQALMAAMLSRALTQPAWWQLIHLLFMPAVWIALNAHIPSVAYLLVFCILLLVFWGTVKGDVPLFLSSTEVAQALSEHIKSYRLKNMIELGAGVGSVVVPLAHTRPELQITALELAPIPWLILRWRCRRLVNVKVIRGSLWEADLQGFDLAFAFLSPLVMVRLGAKLKAEMPQGSWLISSSFKVPDWQVKQVLQLDDRPKTQLFCYRISR
jgi:hypothetical protein